MKHLIYLLGIIALVACNSGATNQDNDANQNIESKSDSSLVELSDSNLNGTWGLTNYFDTIIANKEIAKYRVQIPTWFAIILEIEHDSIKSYGSIEHDQFLINTKSDTISTLVSNISQDNWYLILNDSVLNLIQYPNAERVDSTFYTFRKRDDLSYFTKENKDFYVIGENVTDYFNKQFFEGKYINTTTNNEVVFGENGQLSGFEGYDSYEVRNYFGTLHMHKNLDVITFKNKETRNYKQYNWVFKDDKLLLTEFVHEKVIYDGEIQEGDYLILGKEKIKLKRK
ncbi:hypothetical protein K6119_00575 [Paracrocinitomix mangrovi]|uniref:hypothetical protein n=1 Tax=Paracrocinitomix mangrovi TaxID=2862509 RepID=UPI001C8DAB50|nr:hypothetical protein [Paracrocinitomix mangrovi]UKN02009.1 hypothetical protein K6119_00575 [Paracrocinitomix mangrovi]